MVASPKKYCVLQIFRAFQIMRGGELTRDNDRGLNYRARIEPNMDKLFDCQMTTGKQFRNKLKVRGSNTTLCLLQINQIQT